MIQVAIWTGLAGAAWTINKVAALVAPRREVDVFPHRLWAKGKTWRHLDAYRNGPAAVCIEFGGWTVDVSWKVCEGTPTGAA